MEKIILDKQKEKTYIELVNLLKLIPLKYNYTRKEIHNLIDLLNCENYLYNDKEIKM